MPRNTYFWPVLSQNNLKDQLFQLNLIRFQMVPIFILFEENNFWPKLYSHARVRIMSSIIIITDFRLVEFSFSERLKAYGKNAVRIIEIFILFYFNKPTIYFFLIKCFFNACSSKLFNLNEASSYRMLVLKNHIF